MTSPCKPGAMGLIQALSLHGLAIARAWPFICLERIEQHFDYNSERMSIYNQCIKTQYNTTGRQLLPPSPQPRYTTRLISTQLRFSSSQRGEDEGQEIKSTTPGTYRGVLEMKFSTLTCFDVGWAIRTFESFCAVLGHLHDRLLAKHMAARHQHRWIIVS